MLRRPFQRVVSLIVILSATAACAPGVSGDLTTEPRRTIRGPEPGGSSTADRSPDASPSSASKNPVGPEDGQPTPFRFAVKGDWGAATPAQAAVTAQMCARRAQDAFDDVVSTGDNFYRPDGVATEENYHRPEACLSSHAGHRWRAVWGNHDLGGTSTRTVLGAAKYYTWSSGPVQFYMLDSNRPDKAQAAWLDSGLAATKAQMKVVVFHHPPFTTGTHESNTAVRRSWVPVLERHRVSLVLSGHNHLYEHSEVNGVHYVVSGGGGANLYRCERAEPWLRRCEARHHFLFVEVAGSRITVRAVDSGGATVDQFELRPAGESASGRS